MKIRIKFTKTGIVRFIGHLDIMRYFQKAMRRANIPIKYSEGFSPHQIMSFAAPLGIGLCGTGEYLDIEIADDSSITSKQAIDALNSTMAEGITIVDFKKLPDDSKNSMSLVNSADYYIKPDKEYDQSEISEIQHAIDILLQYDTLMITRQSKKGIDKEVNIRPWIHMLKIDASGLYMNIAQGSEGNLKPQQLIELMGKQSQGGEIVNNSVYTVYRTELYAEDHKSLSDYGIDIV